jgi:hypothetical protein
MKELLHKDGTPMRKYSSPLIKEMNKEDIIERLERIETKLDAVIKALHEYDDDNIYSGYDEPNEALLKAAGLYNEKVAPCKGHDAASWDEEERLNKRMDIIGQNGNEGSHYVTNEEADEDAATFNDYGMRVVKGNDNDIQDKRTVGEKDKHVGKKKRDKWVSPYPPNPKRKFTQDLIPKNKG